MSLYSCHWVFNICNYYYLITLSCASSITCIYLSSQCKKMYVSWSPPIPNLISIIHNHLLSQKLSNKVQMGWKYNLSIRTVFLSVSSFQNKLCHNCISVLKVRKYKSMMLEDLENALAEHAPAGGELASELPPLTIDGIPVSVDKMTQVRLSTAYLLWSKYPM